MNQAVRKVGFVCLPDDRLEIFSAMTRRPGYRPEVVIDFNQNAYSYRMAEILQIPTAADLNILRRFPCQILVIPDDRADLLEAATAAMDGDASAVRTVTEMADELGVPVTPTEEEQDYRPEDFTVPVPPPPVAAPPDPPRPVPDLKEASRLTRDSEIRRLHLKDRLVIDRMQNWNAVEDETATNGKEAPDVNAADTNGSGTETVRSEDETTTAAADVDAEISADAATNPEPADAEAPAVEETATTADTDEAAEDDIAAEDADEPAGDDIATADADEPAGDDIAAADADEPAGDDIATEEITAADRDETADSDGASPGGNIPAAAETLNLAFDKHLLLKRILDIAVNSAGGDAGSIMLLDESGEYLKIAVAIGLSDEVIRSTRQRAGEGVAGSVLMEGNGRVVTGVLSDPPGRSGRSPIAAAACVPIRAGDTAIGVLNVSSESREDAFGVETLALLDKFGLQVAGVILKALELPTGDDSSTGAALTAQIDAILSLPESMPRRLEAVADRLAGLTGASAGRIGLFDVTGKRLEMLGGGRGAGNGRPRFVPADEGIRGWALTRREPETLMSTGSEKDRRAIFYVPLIATDLLGLIELESVPVNEGRRAGIEGALVAAASALAAGIEKDRASRFERRRTEQMLRLSDFAAEMMCAPDSGGVVALALDAVRELFGADLAVFEETGEDPVLSDPEFAGRRDPGSPAVLGFHDAMRAEARDTGRLVTPDVMSAGLTQRLITLDRVRWAAALPLESARAEGATLSLFGMGDDSELPAHGEWAVLEKLVGYMARALRRVPAAAGAGDGFLGWTLFRDRVAEEFKRANRYGRTFALTTIELESFPDTARRRGRDWSDAAARALLDFVRGEIREVDITCRVREGRIAVLSPEIGPDEGAFARRLEERWSEVLPSIKLDGLHRLELKVREVDSPKDIGTWEECAAWIQDPFGDAAEERAAS